jgi:probable F420-dependent oxidoreductase
MAHPRTFRFAVQAHGIHSALQWRELARTVEGLGYSTLQLPDHFVDSPLAPVPALAMAAAATTTLRVGALVFDNDYKHPVVLAKEAATLDLLSDGRFELGLGAGWMRADYDAAGMAYDTPGTRIERMVEGLTIIKGLMADGPFSFSGAHYTVSGLDGAPSPVQRPHPPILIGGGSKRILSVAARHADIVAFNASLAAGAVTAEAASTATAERFDEKVAWARDAAGERWADLELHCHTFVAQITDDPVGLAETMAGFFGISAAAALEVPLVLAGTVDGICETLHARRERYGFSYYSFPAERAVELAPVVARLAGT